jgi:hypothetical protein
MRGGPLLVALLSRAEMLLPPAPPPLSLPLPLPLAFPPPLLDTRTGIGSKGCGGKVDSDVRRLDTMVS